MSDDLHPIQIERIHQMTLSERFGRGLAFLRTARNFVAAGVKSRPPEWTEEQAVAKPAA